MSGNQGNNDDDDEFGFTDEYEESELRQLEARAYSFSQFRPVVEDENADEEVMDGIIRSGMGEISGDQAELKIAILRANDAKDAAIAKLNTLNGEISIVRSQLSAATAAHDHATQNLRGVLASAKDEHLMEIAALKGEIERLQSERRFMEQDVKDAMEKVRAKENSKQDLSPTKPRRQDRGLRDGFDLTVSSIKLAKKRRKVQDNRTNDFGNYRGNDVGNDTVNESGKYKFLLSLANFKVNDDRAFDVMTQCKIELKTGEDFAYSGTLSGAILSSLDTAETADLATAENRILLRILDIWRQDAVKDSRMLCLLLEVLRFVMQFDANELQLGMLQSIVVTCQERFVQLESRSMLYTTDPASRLQSSILDVFASAVECAAGRRDDAEAVGSILAQSVAIEFVLRLLKSVRVSELLGIQYKTQIARALEFLCFAESFGPVVPERSEQKEIEFAVVAELSGMLADNAVSGYVCDDHADFDEYENEIATVKLMVQASQTLTELSQTANGLKLLCEHPTVCVRLMCGISEQLDYIYRTNFLDGNHDRSELIGLMTKLLYTIKTNDERAPLDDSVAGHEFIVGLSRIAFADGAVYHAGLDEMTVECAHKLLGMEYNIEDVNALYGAVTLR
ncbi:hypothetical protein V1512DRAFT_264744 [Lipomyces arxii]|uniref:uncharacterized protein n=1 Tax=Lipomyces arxii TaxID=56418 RepID=UPI0034CE8ED4